ncbi:AraC family transcriptional regulator [Cellulophaga sp. F20128]|uniref:AraC family transcriptional regulator n=1 Tax=Cellulophaga sp. F20128 TaxID=2926413 RepID=UPI001FF6D8E6|nr:AraC family transcriptional regulator [Cellulophaga sp. F20128]MCK0156504.1 AraC family transcriptional regulator [Cellulophaga sp. F20128]
MKSAIGKSPISASKCFKIEELIAPHFDPNWHFHPEYQLAAVFEGTGTRFVGDNISSFEAGDTVLTGANLPHVWRNDDAYFERKDLQTHVVVIYFSLDFLGDVFLKKDEMQDFNQLLLKANRGIEICGATKLEIRQIMQSMLFQKGFNSIFSLFKILHLITYSKDLKFINREGYSPNTVSNLDSKRIKAVYEYILDNYKSDIKIAEVAALANLAPTSFSRYFKIRTNKTFSDFVSELRISLACKLLQNKDYTILQIAHMCGYNTLSNFNRKFKDITCENPNKYRDRFKVVS